MLIRFFFCQDEDLADVAAKQYYVEYGKEMLADRLINLLPSYLPDSQLQGGKVVLEKWAQLVINCHKKVCVLTCVSPVSKPLPLGKISFYFAPNSTDDFGVYSYLGYLKDGKYSTNVVFICAVRVEH